MPLPDALFGTWITHPDDQDGTIEYGSVRIEFMPTGTLIYSVIANDTPQTIFLTYSVMGHTLVTNQPSSPRYEETHFRLEGEEVLILEYGKIESRYLKQWRESELIDAEAITDSLVV